MADQRLQHAQVIYIAEVGLQVTIADTRPTRRCPGAKPARPHVGGRSGIHRHSRPKGAHDELVWRAVDESEPPGRVGPDKTCQPARHAHFRPAARPVIAGPRCCSSRPGWWPRLPLAVLARVVASVPSRPAAHRGPMPAGSVAVTAGGKRHTRRWAVFTPAAAPPWRHNQWPD